MADISITAANVLAIAGAAIEQGVAGGTITAGMVLYKDATSTPANKLKGAVASSTAAAAAVGIALHGASDGQPVLYLKSGGITIGGTVAVGTIYVVTDTAGGIGPIGDRGANDYITILGVGVSATRIDVRIIQSGVKIPA